MSSQDELNVLAQQIRASTRLMQSSRQEWKNAVLQLATALWKARQYFPSNQEFGIWLAENDLLDLGRDDRAALINMAMYSELTGRVIEEMESNSVRLLWAEVERRLRNVANTTSANSKSPEVAETALTVVDSSNDDDEKVENITELSSRNPLHTYSRASEVWAVYKNTETKAELVRAMAKRGSGELWKLILIALDNGFLTKNGVSNKGGFVLRMLFPEASPHGEFSRIDLAKAKTREFAKKVIMPAAIACREQILAEPHRVEEICNEYRRKQQQEKHTQTEQVKHAVALSKLPTTQQEIIAYGQTLWPYEPNGVNDYDWDQVRAACWYFLNLQTCLSISKDNSHGSIALTIRTSIKYLLEYCSFRQQGLEKARDVIRLVKHITFLWDANPQGRCSWPHFPVLAGIEGKWD